LQVEVTAIGFKFKYNNIATKSNTNSMSFVEIPKNSPFTYENLPYGVFSTGCEVIIFKLKLTI